MEISEVAKYNSNQIEQFQRKKLVEILPDIIANTHAFDSFNHIISDINEQNAIELLKTLPYTSKQNVLMNLNHYLRTDFDERTYEVRTGGTSGEILSFLRAKSEYNVEKSHIEYCWNYMGIELGVDKGVVLNARPAKKSDDGFSYIDNNQMLWLGCNDESANHWNRIYDEIIQYRPKYIRGYGSLVARFFKFIDASGLECPPSIKAVTYSSDPMQEAELELIKQKYCDNLISLYGQTERVVMGITCKEGDRYHLLPTYGITEIIGEDGTSIENPGEVGQIVSTSLYARMCSFVRYNTGDMGSWAEGTCECGREGPAISNFLQRSHEIIINKFGEEINIGRRNSFLNFRDKLPIGVGIQFRQDSPGSLHVLIQTTKREIELYKLAIAHLDFEFETTFEFVENPVLNQNGKRTLLVTSFSKS